MAQALKVGERVSIIKTMRVSKDDPAYQQGLKRLTAGQVGQVVDHAPVHEALGTTGTEQVVICLPCLYT